MNHHHRRLHFQWPPGVLSTWLGYPMSKYGGCIVSKSWTLDNLNSEWVVGSMSGRQPESASWSLGRRWRYRAPEDGE